MIGLFMANSAFEKRKIEKRKMKVNGVDKETIIERKGNDVIVHIPDNYILAKSEVQR